MPLGGRAIGENGEVARCFLQPSELEPRIEPRALWGLRGECISVAASESPPDRGADRLVVDDDEAPRLTQSNRRRETGELNEALQRAARQGVAPEVPDISTPDYKVAQASAEIIIEGYRWPYHYRDPCDMRRKAPLGISEGSSGLGQSPSQPCP